MKYMMMMNVPAGPYRIDGWTKEDFEAHTRFMRDFAAELGEAGELVGAEGLAGPDQAKLVRAADDGTPVTDGVFPETKEFLAGYWIIDVDSEEAALRRAAQASAAPGPGGAPLNMPIELRQVLDGPPEDLP